MMNGCFVNISSSNSLSLKEGLSSVFFYFFSIRIRFLSDFFVIYYANFVVEVAVFLIFLSIVSINGRVP